MLIQKAPWNLTDVCAVYLLRLLLGAFLVRVIYPYFFMPSTLVIEMTDRMLVLLLVWFVLIKYKGRWSEFGFSFKSFGQNILLGLVCGIFLLLVSLFSEKIYTSVLLLSPTDHPLVVQAKLANTIKELTIPLILAGIVAPFTEEILYRMFTFLALKQRYGLVAGTLLSAAVFALFHFNAYWLPELLIVGSGLALLYNWTGSLLSCMVAHSAINVSKMMMIFLHFIG